MTSLGKSGRCEKMTCGTLVCTGQIQAASKSFGSDHRNRVQAHQNGSMLFFKYNQVHQALSVRTTSGQAKAFITTSSAHGLLVGDTVHIGNFPANPNTITAVNGIPVTQIVGTHPVVAVSSTIEFTIATTISATSTGVNASAIPLVRIDRYISTDIALASDQGVTWARGTTEPTASHTNTELFYS